VVESPSSRAQSVARGSLLVLAFLAAMTLGVVLAADGNRCDPQQHTGNCVELPNVQGRRNGGASRYAVRNLSPLPANTVHTWVISDATYVLNSGLVSAASTQIHTVTHDSYPQLAGAVGYIVVRADQQITIVRLSDVYWNQMPLVMRPAPTPTAPSNPLPVPPGDRPWCAGSTGTIRIGAICIDGTISTATGKGACSFHQGVACWIGR
jgi:hypothetical protein